MTLYERSGPFRKRRVPCMQGKLENPVIVEFDGYETTVRELATGREELIYICKQPHGWEVIAPEYGLSINHHACKTRQLAMAELFAERPNGKTLFGAYLAYIDKERKPGAKSKLMKIYDDALRDYYKRKEVEER